jgi:hypothetical protein
MSKCPGCQSGNLVPQEGKLEQCSDCYIPTTEWNCDGGCGYRRLDGSNRAWKACELRDVHTGKIYSIPRSYSGEFEIVPS